MEHTELATVEQWYSSCDSFEYRGQRIVFRHGQAEGEVLLLIHGFPTASWDWHKIWPELTSRYTVIAPDMVGFGHSAKPRHYRYNLVDQADLHEALLRDLGYSRYHVLAHDYGDSVAQELLSRDTSGRQLQSLCFLNGGLFPETHRALLIQRLLHSPLGFLLSALLRKKSFDRSFSAVFGSGTKPTAQELEAFWSLIQCHGGQMLFHKLIRYMEERKLHRDRWVQAMQSTSVPLRVIDGEADPVSGAHMVARYRELIPAPDCVLLDSIGHYPQCEAPDQVLQHYLPFLTSHASAS